MQAADLFVLPTYTEGFPNVILEAMAAGKAIISTRVGAIPEMLAVDENESCGLVIAPRDAGALVAALRRSEHAQRSNLFAETRVRLTRWTDSRPGRLPLYAARVARRWRGGDALIPRDWLARPA
jgi:glycosyltransferase involved in cell wall biosynthesis